MGIIWNGLTLFLIFVLRHNLDNLEHTMYTNNHKELADLLRV